VFYLQSLQSRIAKRLLLATAVTSRMSTIYSNIDSNCLLMTRRRSGYQGSVTIL